MSEIERKVDSFWLRFRNRTGTWWKTALLVVAIFAAGYIVGATNDALIRNLLGG